MSVLLLAVLLTLVVVALFTLLNVETQSGGNVALRNQARQNALTALDLAVGEMQKNLGPDQRISATANFLDTNPATEAADGVMQPNWVGVWNSYDWDPKTTPVPAPDPQSTGTFLKWLVSVPTGMTASTKNLPMDATFDPNAAVANDNLVTLVGEGTLGSTVNAVKAGKIATDIDSALRTGHLAWWVGDEGVKAKITQSDPEKASVWTNLKRQFRLLASPRTSLETVAGYETQLNTRNTIETVSDKLPKVLTRDSIPLAFGATPPSFVGTFFDFTPDSKGVLADVRKGGLKKDLSLLLEMPALPDTATHRYLGKKIYDIDYLFSDPADAAKDTTNVDGPRLSGPKWDMIYTYYNLYKSMAKDSKGAFYFDIDAYNRKVMTSGKRDYILPRALRVQYIFGLFHAKKNYWVTTPATTTDPTKTPPAPPLNQPEVLYLSFYPAITLWNPYNVRIQTDQNATGSGMTVGAVGEYWHFPAPPLSFSFASNGSNPKKIRDVFWMYSGSMFSIGFGHYWNGNSAFPFTIEPGGIQVFGPVSPTNPEERYLNNNAVSNPLPGGIKRATLVKKGWDPNGPFHTFQLRGSTAADSFIPMSELSGTVNFSLNFETTNTTNTPLSHAIFEENQNNNNNYVVGVTEFNTKGVTAAPPTDLYPNFPSTQFPGLTAAAIGDITDPFLLFTFNIDYKVFPDSTKAHPQASSRMGLFTDPMQDYWLISNNTLSEAQTGSVQMTVDRLSGGDLTTTDGLPAVRVDPTNNNQGYLGSLGDGIYNNVAVELPTAPLISLGQLQNVGLGRDHGNPLLTSLNVYDGFNSNAATHSDGVNYSSSTPTPMAATFNRPLGNSYAHPSIPANAVSSGRSYDHCIYSNYALWDGWFFSTITPQQAITFSAPLRPIATVLSDFLAGTTLLPNVRILPWLNSATAADVQSALLDNAGAIKEDAHDKSAGYLMIDGSFNVNSTSVKAWAAMLGATHLADVPYQPANNTSGIVQNSSTLYPFPRVSLPNFTAANTTSSYWKGYRELTAANIQDIATKLVEEVKRRGPFLSMADFLNRDVSNNSSFNNAGALQAALDAVNINSTAPTYADTSNAIVDADVSTAGYLNKNAALGHKGDGLTPFVTQADILTPIAPYLSARSDTFVVRAYGDVVSKGGQTLSRAWCEAVVQRIPDYVDSTQTADTKPAALNPTNKTLGRRFKIVQFRWLTGKEV